MGMEALPTALAIWMDTLRHLMAIVIEYGMMVLMLMRLSFLGLVTGTFEILAGGMGCSSTLFLALAKHFASTALMTDF